MKNLSDLRQFHTLTALISLSCNYFNIILSSSWKSRRRFLLCCPMMSFTSLQATKSPSAQHPNPPPAKPFKIPPQTFLNSGTFSDLSRYVGRPPHRTWPCVILTQLQFKYKTHSHSFSVVMAACFN